MNAIQFIKDHGVDKAREVVLMSANALVRCKDNTTFHVDDLKRLVESLTTIEKIGGIDEARKFAVSSLYFTADRTRMHKAIADYEAIGGEHV